MVAAGPGTYCVFISHWWLYSLSVPPFLPPSLIRPSLPSSSIPYKTLPPSLTPLVPSLSLRKGRTSGSLLITTTSWNTGQNTFHGTVIVINQRAEDREPVNQPLVIPEKLLSPAPLEFEVKHMEGQIIRNKPVRFAVYHPGKQNSMI